MKEQDTRILIVEDSLTQAMQLEHILTRHGFQTDVARSGLDALEKIAEDLPTVVISDIVMPNMDGYELCRRMKESDRTRHIPIVLLSALAEPEDIIRGLECGADNFFTKPYEEAFLLSRLQYILANLELRKSATSKIGMEIAFGGRRHVINSDRMQILDLLFSTYETVVQRNLELKRTKEAVQELNRKIEHLHGVALKLVGCNSEDEIQQLSLDAAVEVISFSNALLAVRKGDWFQVGASTRGDTNDFFNTELAERVFWSGRTVVFDNRDEAQEELDEEPHFESVICVPVGSFGVFQAVSEEEDEFTVDDAHMLELLFNHTAEALGRTRLENQLREQAIRDPLTGVYNRHYLDQVLASERKRSKRFGHAVGFVMIDVDKFKHINDTLGHIKGDQVLQAVAVLLEENLRESDILVRYGGDEFLVVMPETGGENTDVVRGRIQAALAEFNQTQKLLDTPLTLSLGLASWDPKSEETIESVLGRADEAMYADKKTHNGGSR